MVNVLLPPFSVVATGVTLQLTFVVLSRLTVISSPDSTQPTEG